VRSPPTMVVFDEDNALLKTLTFEQPTTWLENQLARDPNLWNRTWAVEQLARRTNDSVAAAALANATREADYYRIRAEAAFALSGFPGRLVLPALEAAARDSSAAVREAAVLALGTVGGDQAEALALTAWKKDPSYEVRAGAIRTLARLDSAAAKPVVLAGLTTPSYRDVIQTAAVSAAAQLADSSIVDGLEKVLGDQELVAITLATLARRGDTGALSALVRHRDDKRLWVRRWVLEAIDQELGKAAAQ
jgi:aminopeptidase N